MRRSPAEEPQVHMECHGTGTPLGDPIEIGGLKSINTSRFGGLDAGGWCFTGPTLHGHCYMEMGLVTTMWWSFLLDFYGVPGYPQVMSPCQFLVNWSWLNEHPHVVCILFSRFQLFRVPGCWPLPTSLFRWQSKSAFKKCCSFQHVELNVISAHSLCKQMIHLEIAMCSNVMKFNWDLSQLQCHSCWLDSMLKTHS